MLIERFVNSVFNSNTYLLYKLEEEVVWVIDPGSNTNQLISWLENNNKKVGGILLTHTHFDHIYGLNDLQQKYPDVNVYASFFAKEGMMSEKLNGSLYKEIPFTIKLPEYFIVKENDQIPLWDNIFVKVIETPGHDRDCISFNIDKNLFTGDALIPDVKIFTKLKYGNKYQAEHSIKRIFEHFAYDTIIYPGHGEICTLKYITDSNLYLK
ncbi:MBL fold metallo-hydrolase [Petrimonas sp.]|uniref:MBL fold metallo-hydrolase n=1 Tax=Petrimonas sp. TaxID=2023866 RepID=UPI002FC9C519